MSRLTLPILAALATAMAFSPLALNAQDNMLYPSSTSSPALAERAAFEFPASSSSSSSALSEAPAPSTVVSTPTPAAKASEGGGGPFSGVAVGMRFGLGGVGFDVATPLVPQRLNLRGGASFFSYSPSTISVDNLNVNGSLKLQNASVMADFFPFRGRFRVSGGMTIYNSTGLNAALSVPTGQSISVGGTSYYSDPSAPLSGTGAFTFGGKTAGRVSIGTGNMLPKKGRFTFESEIGVQFFSEPTVAYTFTGEGCATYVAGVYSNCGTIPTANVTSEQQKLQNDLTDLKYFPILSVGLSYRIH
jgi:hypothetical protein